MKLFPYIRAGLIFIHSFPFNPNGSKVEWTDSDAMTAQRFFSHGTGQKLLLRLENAVVNMCLDAVQKGDKHSCGVANGANLQLANIRNHFPLGAAHSTETEESEQEAALDSFAEGAA